MIDEVPDADVGSIGSYNIMAWQAAGAVGVVTGFAHRILEADKAARRALYEETGRELDASVD